MEKENVLLNEDAPLTRYRWAILSLVWLVYFVFGVFTRSMAPLVSPILSDLNMSFVEMGFILGSWQLTYIFFATVDGALIDRWGIKRCLLAGVVILGLSEALRFFATGFFGLLFCVALIGIGGPMVSIGAPKAIALWFGEKERGLATGIYMTAPTIGGFMVLSTANSLVMPLTGNSWRLTFLIYSTIALLTAIMWWFGARDTARPAAKSGTGVMSVFAALARLRIIQVILLMGLFAFTISHGFDNWLPQILEARGIPPATAGITSSIPLITGIFSILILPRITPASYRSYMIAALSLITIAAVLLIMTGVGISLYLGLGLFGLSTLPIMPLLMLILMGSPEVGAKYLGSAAGMFFCVAEVGGFAGPLLLGTIRNTTGGFVGGTVMVIALSVLMALSALYLQKKTARRD